MNRNDFSRYVAMPEGIIIDTATGNEVTLRPGSEYVLCELYDDSDVLHKIPLHRAIAMFLDPEWRENCVVHHKDFNKLNNKLSNLQCMSKKDHSTLHGKARKWNESCMREGSAGAVNLNEPFMNPREVAARYAVNESTVWRWVRKGLLPVHKLGSKIYRFTKEDLAAFESTFERS